MMNPERKRTAAILLWRSMLIISSRILLPFCFLQRPVHSPFPVPDGGQRLSGKPQVELLVDFEKVEEEQKQRSGDVAVPLFDHYFIYAAPPETTGRASGGSSVRSA